MFFERGKILGEPNERKICGVTNMAEKWSSNNSLDKLVYLNTLRSLGMFEILSTKLLATDISLVGVVKK